MYSDFETMWTMLRVANSPSTFAPKRALFADSLVAATLLVGALDRVGEHIDDVLHPEYREQPLGKPIFIVATPRSGTTFLHRLMTHDLQFTAFKLLQTVFPTITGYRAIEAVRRTNGQVGAALRRLQDAADSSYFGAWAGIHNTGFGQEEEDEALWALAFATPAIWLVLPFPERFPHLRFVDQLPPEKRARLVAHYRGCVQRHLYTHPGKTLLGKNVLLPSRFEIVNEALPESRFIHVLRHPYEALPSTLSLFTVPWRWHSPDIAVDGDETLALAKLTIDYYKFLHARRLENDRAGLSRFVSIKYNELLADPIAHVNAIYERFGLAMTPTFQRELEHAVAEQRHYKSDHHYSLEQFGLTKDYVYRELEEIFDYYGFER